jgi:PAS domain S-box-containing protein
MTELYRFAIGSTFVVDLLLGFLVFWTNHRRVANQHFLSLTIASAPWLFCVYKGLDASSGANAQEAEFWIRQASATGIFIGPSFNLLRLAIIHRQESWGRIVARSGTLLFAATLIALLCQTEFFLKSVHVSPTKVATPEYGPGFIIYALFFISVLIGLVVKLVSDMKRTEGVVRNELQFTLLGGAAGLFVGFLLVIVIPLVLGNSESVALSPFGVLLIYAIIAYGIATRRIMDVADILRRSVAYAVLSIYLIALYVIVWSLASSLPQNFVMKAEPLPGFSFPNLLAALCVGFSLIPAESLLQRFKKKLFITMHVLDSTEATRQTNQVLNSISTLSELLKRFSVMISGAIGTDRLSIYLFERRTFVQKYTDTLTELPFHQMSPSDPLVQRLKQSREPIVVDELERVKQTEESEGLSTRLRDLKAEIAIGIRARDNLKGIMFLGSRLSGRAYTSTEIDVLQILCDHLAVALDNAELYTDVQDKKAYNEILLENLVCGVIASDNDGIITVFNPEAERITGLQASHVLNQSIRLLPPVLANVIRQTLRGEQSLRDKKVSILKADGKNEVTISLGSSILKGHAGNHLGAFIVFSDLTAFKKLEMQVRHTDRLASVGTLSAGMAHEIKNPLVAIKTFTQLLPERYSEEEFRQSFFTLVGSEIDRIDTIVNQLLRFSRPTKPVLTPICVHEILEKSLLLIRHQLQKKNIVLEKSFCENDLEIQAHSVTLEQAFINLFMNAIDAMEPGGRLSVSTEIFHDTTLNSGDGELHSTRSIRISIQDTGQGIPSENIPHLFDPFFTTKTHGTGLGLSIVYGIVQEHNGIINVESEIGKGTTFQLHFSLHKEIKV